MDEPPDPPLELRALLGRGGMGEVRVAWDPALEREVAVKLLLPQSSGDPEECRRFRVEARVAASLQHPGILAVYRLGQLPDGRPYFTMPEVHGPRLSDLIRQRHTGRDPSAGAPSLRSLVGKLHQACHAVAHAHERGVVHRDLKPDNIMLGRHGEVWVLDWGLAHVDGDGAGSGRISGTPGYMPPEQARGELHMQGPPSDVYALGAILYEILSGRPPGGEPGAADPTVTPLVAAAATLFGAESFEPDSAAELAYGQVLPAELVRICERALSGSPAHRHAEAGELAHDLAGWLSGLAQREEARKLVARAARRVPRVRALGTRAAEHEEQARLALEGLHLAAPVDAKRDAWSLQDRADALRMEASGLDAEIDVLLEAALAQAPDLQEAHAARAERLRARHAESERTGTADVQRLAASLEAHAHALGAHDPLRAELFAYLDGTGSLSLTVQPAHAVVFVDRYVPVDRRLVATPLLGPVKAPLVDHPLPMGRYLVRVRAPGYAEGRITLRMGRMERYRRVRPGTSSDCPVRLLPSAELGPDDCFVAGGWCWVGGDAEAVDAGPARRVWVDDFVIRRHPVTNRDYLAFLNDLVARGEAARADAHVPRERSGGGGARGAAVLGFDGVRYFLTPDTDGDMWDPEYPVALIDWSDAMAYCAWIAQHTGQPWRLPMQLEWEKAARGGDGRCFPWGDHLDPSWCWMVDSHVGRRLPARVGHPPHDVSPFGAMGLAGNSRDWCLDGPSVRGVADGALLAVEEARDEPGLRYSRGGTWLSLAPYVRSAVQIHTGSTNRLEHQGLRLARSVPPHGP